MWLMRKELNLSDAIYFIVFMMQLHGIPYIRDKQLYSSAYGIYIAQSLLQSIPENTDIVYLEEAKTLLEE